MLCCIGLEFGKNATLKLNILMVFLPLVLIGIHVVEDWKHFEERVRNLGTGRARNQFSHFLIPKVVFTSDFLLDTERASRHGPRNAQEMDWSISNALPKVPRKAVYLF